MNEDSRQMLGEIRALLGEQHREQQGDISAIREDIRALRTEVHQINVTVPGLEYRIESNTAAIAEGKGIVVPLESRVTKIETEKKTERATIWTAILTVPMLTRLAEWLAAGR